ncbi:hypothetical protein J4419_04810 [Candidatus Woesearchaeota archaeon]|nr:hypothetical protein [Candidatus Woesearchaeota archaeon]
MDPLKFYAKEGIKEAMVAHAQNREVGVRYGEGFGKRPDILKFPSEIVDLVKEGASSFHCSEELWTNPKMLSSEMREADKKKLRKGWDLVIDIDIPDWKLSKITCWLIIQALKDFGVSAISVKFSGNKGFHIGVPFESFPGKVGEQETRDLFPEIPRAIALYLLDYIVKKDKPYILVEDNHIIFGNGLKKQFKASPERLKEMTGKTFEELTKRICAKCGKDLPKAQVNLFEFQCRKCGNTTRIEDRAFLECQRCGNLMEKIPMQKSLCECGSNQYIPHFNPFSIIEVDTILIATRHLYRMPYSFHEKSGLISVPFNPEKVLQFEKELANPEKLKLTRFTFIDRSKAKAGEASRILQEAMKFAESKVEAREEREFQKVEHAIPEAFFPPSIKKMLGPLKDGKKRALFILTNFLVSVGWDYEMIEKRLAEWNKQHPEHLRENIIRSHLSYHKRNKEKILPPNFTSDYYSAVGITPLPEELKFKNPVQWAIAKSRKKG